MSALEKIAQISEQDYLSYYDKLPNEKYELIDGSIYAQAGASRTHNKLAMNIGTKLQTHLINNPCQPYISDLKVKVESNYFYPDIVVDCGDDEYMANKPILIIEILSKSTAFLDKTKKLWEYAQLATVQEYATVEQSFKQITLYRRENDWQAQIFETGEIYFKSIDLKIGIDEIYKNLILK
ncbi:Uma2 family endonuclease [Moraxella oblonga]|uniref:Uma2 family endonuclease n=1 Tax=Moraxella oblonga TaxID=200413 RepID=UPI00082E7B9E|nr:Uma2 family endonuclease [Moraxella oblonga]